MMHLSPRGDFAPRHACEAQEFERYRGKLLRVERLRSKVEAAKRAASDSLARANEAPGPHDTENTIFVALFDAHCRDRETLFETMRELDEACCELRAVAGSPQSVNAASWRATVHLKGNIGSNERI
ncbi:hypothetical protein [uncultured Nitratireductor sp.]|uniref:hypothetical protein n=1 Tax=uncultured Nitratireductor sp. TaxID=520953 RepID=UPI00260092B3|nr:hypothetical protein [uncultured Nitratireductor sp.]